MDMKGRLSKKDNNGNGSSSASLAVATPSSSPVSGHTFSTRDIILTSALTFFATLSVVFILVGVTVYRLSRRQQRERERGAARDGAAGVLTLLRQRLLHRRLGQRRALAPPLQEELLLREGYGDGMDNLWGQWEADIMAVESLWNCLEGDVWSPCGNREAGEGTALLLAAQRRGIVDSSSALLHKNGYGYGTLDGARRDDLSAPQLHTRRRAGEEGDSANGKGVLPATQEVSPPQLPRGTALLGTALPCGAGMLPPVTTTIAQRENAPLVAAMDGEPPSFAPFQPRDDKDKTVLNTTHDSRYQIVKRIGDGAFSSVYLVKRKHDGKRYAMKYLICADDRERLAAIRECETINSVQGHPNVIRLVDMFMNFDFQAKRSHFPQEGEDTSFGRHSAIRALSSRTVSPRLAAASLFTMQQQPFTLANGGNPRIPELSSTGPRRPPQQPPTEKPPSPPLQLLALPPQDGHHQPPHTRSGQNEGFELKRKAHTSPVSSTPHWTRVPFDGSVMAIAMDGGRAAAPPAVANAAATTQATSSLKEQTAAATSAATSPSTVAMKKEEATRILQAIAAAATSVKPTNERHKQQRPKAVGEEGEEGMMMTLYNEDGTPMRPTGADWASDGDNGDDNDGDADGSSSNTPKRTVSTPQKVATPPPPAAGIHLREWDLGTTRDAATMEAPLLMLSETDTERLMREARQQRHRARQERWQQQQEQRGKDPSPRPTTTITTTAFPASPQQAAAATAQPAEEEEARSASRSSGASEDEPVQPIQRVSPPAAAPTNHRAASASPNTSASDGTRSSGCGKAQPHDHPHPEEEEEEDRAPATTTTTTTGAGPARGSYAPKRATAPHPSSSPHGNVTAAPAMKPPSTSAFPTAFPAGFDTFLVAKGSAAADHSDGDSRSAQSPFSSQAQRTSPSPPGGFYGRVPATVAGPTSIAVTHTGRSYNANFAQHLQVSQQQQQHQQQDGLAQNGDAAQSSRRTLPPDNATNLYANANASPFSMVPGASHAVAPSRPVYNGNMQQQQLQDNGDDTSARGSALVDLAAFEERSRTTGNVVGYNGTRYYSPMPDGGQQQQGRMMWRGGDGGGGGVDVPSHPPDAEARSAGLLGVRDTAQQRAVTMHYTNFPAPRAPFLLNADGRSEEGGEGGRGGDTLLIRVQSPPLGSFVLHKDSRTGTFVNPYSQKASAVRPPTPLPPSPALSPAQLSTGTAVRNSYAPRNSNATSLGNEGSTTNTTAGAAEVRYNDFDITTRAFNRPFIPNRDAMNNPVEELPSPTTRNTSGSGNGDGDGELTPISRQLQMLHRQEEGQPSAGPQQSAPPPPPASYAPARGGANAGKPLPTPSGSDGDAGSPCMPDVAATVPAAPAPLTVAGAIRAARAGLEGERMHLYDGKPHVTIPPPPQGMGGTARLLMDDIVIPPVMAEPRGPFPAGAAAATATKAAGASHVPVYRNANASWRSSLGKPATPTTTSNATLAAAVVSAKQQQQQQPTYLPVKEAGEPLSSQLSQSTRLSDSTASSPTHTGYLCLVMEYHPMGDLCRYVLRNKEALAKQKRLAAQQQQQQQQQSTSNTTAATSRTTAISSSPGSSSLSKQSMQQQQHQQQQQQGQPRQPPPARLMYPVRQQSAIAGTSVTTHSNHNSGVGHQLPLGTSSNALSDTRSRVGGAAASITTPLPSQHVQKPADPTANNPLTEAQLLSIAFQLASVLDHLHSQSPPVVHRDLKPENILIKGDPKDLLLMYHQQQQQQQQEERLRQPSDDAREEQKEDEGGRHPRTGSSVSARFSSSNPDRERQQQQRGRKSFTEHQGSAAASQRRGTPMAALQRVGSSVSARVSSPHGFEPPSSPGNSSPSASGVASPLSLAPPSSAVYSMSGSTWHGGKGRNVDVDAVAEVRVWRNIIPVVVTDFGLAIVQEEHRRQGRGGGTRPYIAPESWKGMTSTASDVWGYGCVLYALATGRLTAKDVRIMSVEATKKDRSFASMVLNDIIGCRYSLAFASFVVSLLVVDPAKRPTAAMAARCFRVGEDEDGEDLVLFDETSPFFSNVLDL